MHKALVLHVEPDGEADSSDRCQEFQSVEPRRKWEQSSVAIAPENGQVQAVEEFSILHELHWKSSAFSRDSHPIQRNVLGVTASRLIDVRRGQENPWENREGSPVVDRSSKLERAITPCIP